MRGRVVLLLLACLLGGRLAPPAQAVSYPEQGRPVYLGMGGASFAGGSVDAGSGAACFKMAFGSLASSAHVPIPAGFIYKGQDNSPGPFGPGTSMSQDWFLQPVTPGTLAPCELVGPGNRRYAFATQQYPYDRWIDTRDPEMLGAVLNIPNPPFSDHRNWLVWKDGAKWYFDGYGSQGLQSIVDAHGNTVISGITRSVNTGIATQVSVPSGSQTRTITYTIPWAQTEVTQVTISYSASGPTTIDKVWNLAYDTGGAGFAPRLISITNPKGGVTHLTWSTYTRDDGQTVPLLVSVTNPRGNLVYSNQYDSLGRVSKQTFADGGFLTASYPAGAIGTTGITTVTDPRGGVRTYGCVWEPAVNGHLAGYHFANFGDALGRVTQWNQLHSGSWLDTQILDYKNRSTTLTWDYAKGNLLSRSWTTPLGNTATESFGYDPACSTCTSATDALGRSTTSTVNAAGDIMTTTNPRSYMTSVTRDSFGDATAVTNALSQTSNRTFGLYGEPLTTTDPLSHTTTRTFDLASRLASTQDANGKVVHFTYDLMDRLLTSSQTVNGVVLTTTNVYDADGNRTRMVDPKNQAWNWSFDSMDRVSQATDPLSKSVVPTYDHNSNVVGVTDRAGNTAAYTYDAENRPLSKVFTKFGGATDSTVTYHYDGTTHLLTSVGDSAAPGSQTWSYTYDSLDRPTSVTTPYGTVSVGLNDKIARRETLQAGSQGLITYGYDADDNRVSILQNSATATLNYDALDRLSQQSLPATPNPVTTAWAFDNAGFVSSVTSLRNGTTLDSHSYLRDAVGNITQETLTGATNSTSTFGYDDLYRLTSATVAGTGYTWAYDAVGNRTSQSVGGVNTSYTVDAADHLLTVNGAAVTSDANGSVLQDETGGAYSWDVRGRLVGLTKGGSSYLFQYGPDGLRLNKSVNGVLTTYLLDGGQVVTENINGTPYQTLYGPGTDHALARNGEFFLPNCLGSTALLTDGGGNSKQSYQYSPFGSLLNSPTENNPFQFTGREDDGSGLLYCRARYYNPGWGRFASADPLGFGGGINPYVYARNNPVNRVDATGRDDTPPDASQNDQNGSDDGSSDGGGDSAAKPADDSTASEDAQTAVEEDAIEAAMSASDANSGNPDAAADEDDGSSSGSAAQPAGGGPGGRMSPWQIKYSQDSVSWNSRDRGYNIGDTVYKLLTEPEFDTPPVRVFERGGDWWTLDNRRVLTYRSAGRDVPYTFATRQEVADESTKFTTRDGGVTVYIKMPRGWR